MKPITLNLTATVTEATTTRTMKKVLFLKNDGAVDLYVSFEKALDMGAKDYFLVKAGERFENLEDVDFTKVYYACASSTCDFRLYGVNLGE